MSAFPDHTLHNMAVHDGERRLIPLGRAPRRREGQDA